MDVHAPHEPIHSWRDIALHLGVVTVGLFIALSLEGLVDHIHNRHLVAEARENIRQEIQSNHEAAQQDLGYLQQDILRTKANLATVRRIIADQKHFHGSMNYNMEFNSPSDAAWTTARETGALGFMPYSEVQRYSDLYHTQAMVTDQVPEIVHRQTLALTPAIMYDNFGDIPPNQLEALLHDTTATLIELSTLRQVMDQLDKQYVAQLKQ
jgi:hypothetical protein